MVSWDGRLDNGSDLRVMLGVSSPEQLRDVDIVCHAYARWGRDCFDRLIGDWAVVIWDPRQQLLYFARDPFGTRPLFYHRAASQIVWSSRLEPILDATRVTTELDESWLAGYFAESTPPGSTPYRVLREVPPGSLVVVKEAGEHVTTFWQPRAQPKLRYSCDEEYEEHFEHLFRQAVRRRLRSSTPAGADLSGGLDSSSIVCIGHDLIRRGHAEAPDLLPISYVYDDCTSTNEKRYIKCIERATGRSTHMVRHEDFSFFGPQPDFEYPSFLQCYWEREHHINTYLASKKAAIYLRGIGGDELMLSEAMPELELADLVVSGHLLRLLKVARRSSLVHNRSLPALLLRDLPYPVLASRFGSLLRYQEKPSEWIDKRFATRTGLCRLFNPELAVDASVKLPTDRFRVMLIQESIRFMAWFYDRGDSRLQSAYPFLDRDLVEYCLALPYSQLIRGRETRSVQRRALAHLLPQEVCHRSSKAALDEALIVDLRRAWPGLAPILEAPMVSELGLVNADIFRETLLKARFGLRVNFYRLCHVLSLEHWLRRWDQRQAPSAREQAPVPSTVVPSPSQVGERVPA
jgi:asparagine synthase (glutamine-hydrolysing)